MKCVILGRYIRMVGKAIHALAKVGEELYLEPLPDCLAFHTVNSSRSALMTFKFYKDFFEEYEEKSPEDLANIETSSQNPSKCRLMMRSILMVFKSINILEKTVESCHIHVLGTENKVKIRLNCKFSITKLYSFPFIESETLQSFHSHPIDGNTFTCQARVLNEAALNFLKNQEEVTMTASADKFIMKNYVSSNPRDNLGSVHTELTMHPHEFESFQVRNDTSFTYCLKELRSMIGFADSFTLPLTAIYGASNEPIFFNVSHTDVFEGSLVMATMANENSGDPNSSMNTSQSNSTFRATEDLLIGRNRGPRPSTSRTSFGKRERPQKASVSHVSATQNSNVSVHHRPRADEDLFNFNESIHDISNNGGPRMSTLDIAQDAPIPRFSEGLDEVLDQTKDVTNTPPSKRARFLFKRCFEKTLDMRSLPGCNNVLAPDSDEEN